MFLYSYHLKSSYYFFHVFSVIEVKAINPLPTIFNPNQTGLQSFDLEHQDDKMNLENHVPKHKAVFINLLTCYSFGCLISRFLKYPSHDLSIFLVCTQTIVT